jgi:ribosomal-protein-alanine N-acetyltransferase
MIRGRPDCMNPVNVADVFGDLPALETERLRLRRVAPDDAGAIFAYCADPEVARYTSWAPHASLEETRAVVAAWVEGYRRGRVTPRAVEHKAPRPVPGRPTPPRAI